MIHVQIASHVTATGVSGVRWVLLDDAERPEPALGPAAPAAPPKTIGDYRQTPLQADKPRGSLSLLAWKGLVLVLGLGLAVWAAQGWFGPAPVPWRPASAQSRPADAVKPVLEAPPASPRIAPPVADELPPPPGLPASAPGPLLTATST
jgi:hypothetical protein